MTNNIISEAGIGTTVADIGRRARGLAMRPSMFLDYDDAVATLSRGEGMPRWATEWSSDDGAISGDAGEISFDGENGIVRYGATVVYGDYADLTSTGPTVYIGGSIALENATLEELREASAALTLLADQIEGVAR